MPSRSQKIIPGFPFFSLLPRNDGAASEQGSGLWELPPSLLCTSEFVFHLEATDKFLKNRVKNLPESVIQERNYEQEEFLHRLARHREAHLKNETALEYFEDLEISPVLLGDLRNRTFFQTIFTLLGLKSERTLKTAF